ncbi:hypothetical protein SAMN06265795_102570 [Noviherbaspirillum humi]|uniref:Uncharacterized protein n=1 Tax=Noviherbaspirillum humi TaxID=1688639 RepID=A0A239E821_9BURK|nr:hypothetical protein SAMN06265795_102570 [Noviherbaspirillum humi]
METWQIAANGVGSIASDAPRSKMARRGFFRSKAAPHSDVLPKCHQLPFFRVLNELIEVNASHEGFVTLGNIEAANCCSVT